MGLCSVKSRTPTGWVFLARILVYYPYSVSFGSVGSGFETVAVASCSDSKVLIVENGVLMLNYINGWNSVDFLLDVDMNSWVLNDEWHFLGYGVLFNLPNGELSDVGDFIWHLDLSGVMLPEFNYVWLFNGNSEEVLVPFGLLELVFNGVWFFFVLSHFNLFAGDEWNLLNNSVVNSLSGFVGDGEFLFIWDLVIDGVWNFLGDNIWDLVDDGVWNLSAGGVGDLKFNLVWNLSLNSVWDFSGDLIWLKSLNFILLGDIVGSSNLVWNRVNFNNWNLLGDLILLGHVFSDSVVVFVSR